MIRYLQQHQIAKHRIELQVNGFTVIPEFLDTKILSRYAEDIPKIAEAHGTKIDKPAGGPGAIGDEPLQYTVLEGTAIRHYLSPLYRWVTNYDFYRMIEAITGEILKPDRGISADRYVNVNYLKGIDAKYQFHTDSHPYTGILFMQDFDESMGGELEIHCPTYTVTLRPQVGLFLLFDGQRLPHRVLPLRMPGHRISVPLNLFIEPLKEADEQLENYLYAGDPADLDEVTEPLEALSDDDPEIKFYEAAATTEDELEELYDDDPAELDGIYPKPGDRDAWKI